MKITISLGTEATEMIGEISNVIGTPPGTLISMMANMTLGAWYTEFVLNSEIKRNEQIENAARAYVIAHMKEERFKEYVFSLYDDERPEISAREVMEGWLAYLGSDQHQSGAGGEVVSPLLEPQEDLVKLDEESRWDYKRENTIEGC